MILEGKIWRYGDNVDTDAIIPARYLNIADPKELAKHCMEDIDKTFVRTVQTGDIMVAGKNFGCGSSREHAPVAIKVSGIVCVIAETFARIFYRNAINIGLPLFEIGSIVSEFKTGQTVRVDLTAGTVVNVDTGFIVQCNSLPPFIQEIADAGGLIEYVKKSQ